MLALLCDLVAEDIAPTAGFFFLASSKSKCCLLFFFARLPSISHVGLTSSFSLFFFLVCPSPNTRSHSIFTLKIMIKECMPDGQEVMRNGQLNLVDLAGLVDFDDDKMEDGHDMDTHIRVTRIHRKLLVICCVS